jgi:hypothetical protein
MRARRARRGLYKLMACVAEWRGRRFVGNVSVSIPAHMITKFTTLAGPGGDSVVCAALLTQAAAAAASTGTSPASSSVTQTYSSVIQ